MQQQSKKLLEVENLKKYFPIKRGIFQRTVGYVKAVDDISFSIYEGETLGLVGESGCGKTTTGMTILRLEKPTSGSILFGGTDIASMKKNDLRNIRKKMQIIFQDPYSSLDPRMTVFEILQEPLKIHHIFNSKAERIEYVEKLLHDVGLSADYMTRYPHEFSGGQRQRIGIARALAVNPRLIIADEPVSALDVSIQSQILNLLNDLKKRYGITFLFIAHDLSVVKHISDRVAVMYLGKIVEITDKRELYRNPLHPYTKSLLSAIPIPDPNCKRQRIVLEGDVPSPVDPPPGCRFSPRCPEAKPICHEVEPLFKDHGGNHYSACHALS